MTKLPAELTMERETRVSYGQVPDRQFDEPLPDMSWQLRGDEFLLRAPGDHFFHYRRRCGITIERGPGADIREETLWLNGSVYAAVASLNGLMPIHASAVACHGGVYAFTGPAGAGKSTLVAALSARGLPMFCDDTLLLDLSSPDRIMCLPGHKRLKLTPEAVELAGAIAEEQVSATVGKVYARPAAGTVGTALPLAELLFLEEGPTLGVSVVTGSERFLRLRDDHYTARIFATARQFDHIGEFSHLASLARNIRMVRFARPRDHTRFNEGVDALADHIISGNDGV